MICRKLRRLGDVSVWGSTPPVLASCRGVDVSPQEGAGEGGQQVMHLFVVTDVCTTVVSKGTVYFLSLFPMVSGVVNAVAQWWHRLVQTAASTYGQWYRKLSLMDTVHDDSFEGVAFLEMWRSPVVA